MLGKRRGSASWIQVLVDRSTMYVISSCSRIYPLDRVDLYMVPSTLVLKHQKT